ncbi:MAG: porin [Burkholderiales bacterium]|jgi:predicted porin|nr:MAG: porin [Burkholderiales bacterium]
MTRTVRTATWRGVQGLLGLMGMTLSWHAQAQQQAPTVIYGILDIGFGRYQASGLTRTTEVRSGQMAASRIGFTQKEDLGDGVFAGYTLESFLRLDTGASGRNDTDPFWSREAFVQLGSSKLGSVRMGRMSTPLFDATARFNAFGASPGFSPALRHTFASGVLESVQGDQYWNSSIAYVSPNVEGFSLKAMHAYEPNGANRGNSSVGLTYSRGLVALAVTAQTVRIDSRQPDGSSEGAWQIAGSYNAGFGRVFALYGQNQDSGFDVASKVMSVGCTIRLWEGNVLAQFAQTNAQGDAIDRQHQTMSLGYDYELSKRQDVYLVMMRDQIRLQPNGLTLATGIRYLF